MTNWVMKEHGVPLSRLTVIRIATTEDYKMCKSFANQNHVHWLCQCECGGEKITTTTLLTTGHVTSCGCCVSKGEERIAQILRNNNILFVQQKIFKDLNTGPKGYLRYDFYINNDFLLEFDGRQHFYETPIGWNQSLQNQKRNDQLKNDYAKSHNIPLKRIPYWDFDKITLENIMSDKWLINN